MKRKFKGADEKSDIFFETNLTGCDGGMMIVCALTMQKRFQDECKTNAKQTQIHPPGAIRMGAFFTVIGKRYSQKILGEISYICAAPSYKTLISPWLCPFTGLANQSSKNCSSSSATGRWNRPRSFRIPRL